MFGNQEEMGREARIECGQLGVGPASLSGQPCNSAPLFSLLAGLGHSVCPQGALRKVPGGRDQEGCMVYV